MLKMPGEPHEMRILVQQLATGKTNQDGRRLFGRVMRHKDVLVCGVGAFAMYLALRFHITKEFEETNFPLTNWMENHTWFDFKLLVDAFNPARDWTIAIKSNPYSIAIKTVLRELRLPSSHYVHLGRKIGPKELEMLQAEASQIDQLGNWSTNVRDQRYSAKLPVEAIKLKAGFTKSATHHNVRQGIKVPQVLLQASPFAFSYVAEQYVNEATLARAADQHQHGTAIKFIQLMKELNVIFLQDKAAILVADPARQAHPIFSHLPVFQMEEWTTFIQLVRTTIDADTVATASRATMGVEQYLPGLLDQFAGLQGRFSSLEQKIDQHKEEMEQKIDHQREATVETMRQLFLDAAERLSVIGTGTIITHQMPQRPLVPRATTVTTGAITTQRPVIHPSPKYDSLSKLWLHWLDCFEQLDATGAGWRTYYSPSETKHFSRVKQVFTGMKEYIKRHHHGEHNTPEQLLALLDDKFMHLKRSLPRMIAWMQQEGYLHKGKSRGRSKK
jgi:hypothetical protein